jgi:L-ornithine Nalpha-acyltransferase
MNDNAGSVGNSIRVSKGDLLLRLARNKSEVEACQKLRYRVFYEELAARPDRAAARNRTDADRFDDICDHLVVIRTAPSSAAEPLLLAEGELVGTYRVLRQAVAAKNGGFYTQEEYNIAPMLAAHPELNFLELGRSCVLQPYRTKPVVELLWQGIWNYVRAHGLDVMFGCASFEGTDPNEHAAALSFLEQTATPPAEWRVKALPDRYIEMNRMNGAIIEPKAALRALPPLIKGYLRLGCHIGEGAVIDDQFNTIDVLIILPVSAIDSRYFAHFGQPRALPGKPESARR